MIDPGQLNFAGGRKRGMQSDPAGEPPEHLRSDRIEQGAFEVGAERKSVFESPVIQFQRKGFPFAVNCSVPQGTPRNKKAAPLAGAALSCRPVKSAADELQQFITLGGHQFRRFRFHDQTQQRFGVRSPDIEPPI